MRLSSIFTGAVLLATALAATPVAHAQQPAKSASDTAASKVLFAEVMIEASHGRYMDADSVGREKLLAESSRYAADAANGYRALAADPAGVRLMQQQVMSAFYSGKAGARGAMQVSQTADEQQIRLSLLRAAQEARIIEQNDRIIQLLEQIAKKK